MNVNLNELKSWIGNEETTFDEVTKSLETRFRATLDIDPGNPKNGEILHRPSLGTRTSC